MPANIDGLLASRTTGKAHTEIYKDIYAYRFYTALGPNDKRKKTLRSHSAHDIFY